MVNRLIYMMFFVASTLILIGIYLSVRHVDISIQKNRESIQVNTKKLEQLQRYDSIGLENNRLLKEINGKLK